MPDNDPHANAWLVRGPLPVVVLLVCHVVLGLSAVDRESLTFDEGVHLTGGLCYWTANDYRLHPENGNWSQRWASLPLALGGYHFPPHEGRAWRESDLWENSDRLLYEIGNDSTAMLRRGRAMMGIASVLLGLLVYGLSRHWFGAGGALISLTLYSFSPAFLANGFLATSDLFAALFFTAASCAVWKVLNHVTPLSVALAGFSIAGLMLSKFSGVLIVPIAAVLAGIRLSDAEPLRVSIGRPRTVTGLHRLAALAAIALSVVLIATFIIWASYGFRYSAFAPGSEEGTRFLVDWRDVKQGLPAWFGDLLQIGRDYHLLPEAHLFGFAYTIFSGGRFGFLNGESSQAGWLSFFPHCLVLKTPLTLFVLIGLAAWGYRLRHRAYAGSDIAQQSRDRLPRIYDLSPLVVLLVVYWAFALKSSLNIGHRHILPTYPPLFILAGAAVTWWGSWAGPSRQQHRDARRQAPSPGVGPPRTAVVRMVQIVILGSLAISAFETLWFWPHYLAYFNPLAGGPSRAYRRLVDSSLDWGQDLTTLRRWFDDHPDDLRRVYLSYFGMARPEYYGIDAQLLPGFRPRWDSHAPRPLTGGLYCASATMLQSVYLKFPGRWNSKYEREYQQLRRVFEPLIASGEELSAFERAAPHLSPDELQTALRDYEDLRFGRLCSFLRQREPDGEAGYSILIYRVSDTEIDRALHGAAVELLPQPETES